MSLQPFQVGGDDGFKGGGDQGAADDTEGGRVTEAVLVFRLRVAIAVFRPTQTVAAASICLSQRSKRTVRRLRERERTWANEPDASASETRAPHRAATPRHSFSSSAKTTDRAL